MTRWLEPDEGTYKWGITTSQAYFPKDSTAEFDNDLTIAEWVSLLQAWDSTAFLPDGPCAPWISPGRDGVKKVKVLSGGEKVRCLLSKMMISGANCLLARYSS